VEGGAAFRKCCTVQQDDETNSKRKSGSGSLDRVLSPNLPSRPPPTRTDLLATSQPFIRQQQIPGPSFLRRRSPSPVGMSTSSIALARKSIAKQTAAWPKDVLRPQVQFSACLQSLVDARLDQLEKDGNQTLDAEERAVVDSLQTGLRDLMSNKWRNQVGRALRAAVAGSLLAAADLSLYPPRSTR
jgi:hypothetical protein